VALCSARTGEGIPRVWGRIEQFFRELEPKGVIAKRRQQQTVDWFADMIQDELQRRLDHNPRAQSCLPGLRESVLRGEITPGSAVRGLFAEIDKNSHYDNKN
jgi:LAO/AO transport system kinase